MKSRNEIRARRSGSVRSKVHGFYGDVAADYRIVRAIHHAHSSATQFIQKLVAAGFGKCRHSEKTREVSGEARRLARDRVRQGAQNTTPRTENRPQSNIALAM